MKTEMSITPDTLAKILDKLGVERVERAINHPNLHAKTWHSCFLACCYGEPGELEKLDVFYPGGVGTLSSVAKILGLTILETSQIINAFDGYGREFRRLVRQWLEDDIKRNNNATHCEETSGV